jgi:PIN domain nuclease of toxin-antitoxin system
MIVLDTHTLIWLSDNPSKLSAKALKVIREYQKAKDIYVSSFTVWEIALLVKKERLTLSLPFNTWIEKIESTNYLHFVPVDNAISIDAIYLPGNFHSDPADRIIVATARSLGAKLVTADAKIRKYKHVKTVW